MPAQPIDRRRRNQPPRCTAQRLRPPTDSRRSRRISGSKAVPEKSPSYINEGRRPCQRSLYPTSGGSWCREAPGKIVRVSGCSLRLARAPPRRMLSRHFPVVWACSGEDRRRVRCHPVPPAPGASLKVPALGPVIPPPACTGDGPHGWVCPVPPVEGERHTAPNPLTRRIQSMATNNSKPAS